MIEPIAFGAVTAALITSAPHWLTALEHTIFNAGEKVAIKQGKQVWQKHYDKKEFLKHLEQALKLANEHGLSNFQTIEERDQYRDVLAILAEPGPHSDTLRREALQLLTLSGTPNLAELNEIYNRSLRFRSISQPIPPTEVDAAKYLSVFFITLIAELYADQIFRQQMSDVLKDRAAQITQQLLPEVVAALQQIKETVTQDYKEEQFEQDSQTYVAHVERSTRRLKMAGIVLKDKNPDPELNGIFVPVRIEVKDETIPEKKREGSIVTMLEHYPYLVLLGGPGSGKSTVTRHLAWSHAVANLSNSSTTNVFLLSGYPLPLRIELRRLTEDRRNHPYSFLSYTTKVLLGRESVEVNPDMFKQLLEQRRMLLLFDGLDEVTTLEERRRLIEEIEHFAEHFPGNRILVTSRPVGYDLARFSNPMFYHANVQEFNDAQIRQFLERWYTYVLRLSPLPSDDKQELQTLFKTLKENSRLHKLAVNPLLLTVISALHRYERLPDRRVLIYDHCANLLLETWAKLKGTDVRWKDMKMVKEDQYACVAHLGFVLHERTQDKLGDNPDEEETSSTEDIASDVPAKFMLNEIERFLVNRKLITDPSVQRIEAKLLLKLIQEEAGLIVERGKDESSEDLYGFVHRTFQEYFAAFDVFERFQQEVDLRVIIDFLEEQLHDPHWREVILLLLGKLKPKPVTILLRNLLEGKIKSHRSQNTDTVQQDIFFICDCLIEEIAVENEFAEIIVSSLSLLAKTSPFLSQVIKAIQYLGSLTQTRQYASSAKKELRALIDINNVTNINTIIRAAMTLCLQDTQDSEDCRQALQTIIELNERTDITVEQRIQVTEALFRCSLSAGRYQLEEEQLLNILLIQLAKNSNLSIDEQVKIADLLFWTNLSPKKNERQQSFDMLIRLAQRTDLSIEQYVQVADVLRWHQMMDEDGEQPVATLFLRLAQRTDLSNEEQVKVAKGLQKYSSTAPEEERYSLLMLLRLARRTDLSIEQYIQVADTLYKCSSASSKEKQQATELLLRLAERTDLSVEQEIQIADALQQRRSTSSSEEEQQVIEILLRLAERTDLSVEQQIQVIENLRLCSHSLLGSEQAVHSLLKLAQLHEVSVKQQIQIADRLEQYSLGLRYRREITQVLLQHIQNSESSFEQLMQIAKDPYWNHFSSYKEKQNITQMILNLAQHNELSIDQQVEITKVLFKLGSSTEKHQFIQTLLHLTQQRELPVEQQVHIAETLYDLSASISEKEREQQAFKLLSDIAQRTDLTYDQQIQVNGVLYKSSPAASVNERQAAQNLLRLIQDQTLTINQRLLAIRFLFDAEKVNYTPRIQTLQIMLLLLKNDDITRFLEDHWQTNYNAKANPSDIKIILEFTQNNILPSKVRHDLYLLLQNMIPQFNLVKYDGN